MKYSLYKYILLTVSLVITAYFVSCTAGSCFEETEAKSKASFYSMATKKAQPPDSISLFGFGMDTLLIYDKALSQKSAAFPLFAADTVRRFILRINGINDTMEYRYSSSVHLISRECGYTYFFSLDTVIFSRNIIDSVSIIKKTATTANEENIRIFY